MRRILALLAFCLAIATVSPGQTFTTLANFSLSTGTNPSGSLIQAPDGNFYGLLSSGGAFQQAGVLFKMTPDGVLTTLYNFCMLPNCADGDTPEGTLIQADDGSLYGTTLSGGAQHAGTIFQMPLGGELTTLHSFDNTDGFLPRSGVIQASDGNFYGTTDGGGLYAYGTVFKMTRDLILTTLHGFSFTEGNTPIAGLVQGSDGNFYGTTTFGGQLGLGTIFKITPDGVLTTLHSFDSGTGEALSGLVQGSDGNFYGVTSIGGTGQGGTLYKITPQGVLTTLYNFCSQQNCIDGRTPNGPLVLATDGNFYGTTATGGQDVCACGTIFKITPNYVLTTLHSFNDSDGGWPFVGLVQANDGSFYGMTTDGGGSNYGTVFRLIVYPALTVAKSGMGTVTSLDRHIYCGDACSYWYFDGEQITLSAVPAPGYTFSGWTGCDNMNGSYCYVTMTGARNVTATFAPADVTLTSLTVKPTYVRGGQLSAGTLTLNGPAPQGGVTVALSSDHPAAAHPPSFVFVPGGKSSVQFSVQTFPVKGNTTVMITATAGASQVSGTLMVGTTFAPPMLK